MLRDHAVMCVWGRDYSSSILWSYFKSWEKNTVSKNLDSEPQIMTNDSFNLVILNLVLYILFLGSLILFWKRTFMLFLLISLLWFGLRHNCQRWLKLHWYSENSAALKHNYILLHNSEVANINKQILFTNQTSFITCPDMGSCQNLELPEPFQLWGV